MARGEGISQRYILKAPAYDGSASGSAITGEAAWTITDGQKQIIGVGGTDVRA
jgi:hypothetical protein